MMRGTRRICDRCGGGIPSGGPSRILYCKPGVARLHLGIDGPGGPERLASNLVNGMIRLDICPDCAAGKAAPGPAPVTPPPA